MSNDKFDKAILAVEQVLIEQELTVNEYRTILKELGEQLEIRIGQLYVTPEK